MQHACFDFLHKKACRHCSKTEKPLMKSIEHTFASVIVFGDANLKFDDEIEAIEKSDQIMVLLYFNFSLFFVVK